MMISNIISKLRRSIVNLLTLVLKKKQAIPISTVSDLPVTFVSSGLFGPPPTKIDQCRTAEDIAVVLGYSYEDLAKLIYPFTAKNYRNFLIPKKSGSSRVIQAPKVKLKALQRKVSNELLDYFQPRASAHGFIKERSIVSNSYPHTNKKYVFNIDLEDFFGSIHFGRVRNLFKSYPFNLPYSAATVLANICCNNNSLPQGAPTSPIISNMICHKLDRQLQKLAKKYQCSYSRYADDITFSFSVTKRNLPLDIVRFDSKNDVVVGGHLKKIINDNGYKINQKKVRIKPYSQKQEVTGLIVNEKVNVKRSFVRKTSSMLHAWKKYGLIDAEKEYLSKYRKKKLKNRHKMKIAVGDGEFFIKVVKGRVNFIKMVKGKDDPIYKKLAYQLTEALGCPNENYIKTKEMIAADSIFILENDLSASQGTAFVLKDIGIVTNCHIVEDIDLITANQLDLFRYNEVTQKRKVRFRKSDLNRDLAIFDPAGDFSDIKELPIGDDSIICTGFQVIVVGYPQYTEGAHPFISRSRVVQSRQHFGKNVWIIDSPIVHGNSGGPVFNSNMEVIGVATAGSETHSGETVFNGFIPISNLLDYANSP